MEAKYAALSGECHFLSFTSVEAVGAKQLIVYKDRYRHLSEWCGLRRSGDADAEGAKALSGDSKHMTVALFTGNSSKRKCGNSLDIMIYDIKIRSKLCIFRYIYKLNLCFLASKTKKSRRVHQKAADIFSTASKMTAL